MTQKLTAEEIGPALDANSRHAAQWNEASEAPKPNGAFGKLTTSVREEAFTGSYASHAHEAAPRCRRIRYASNETNYCARMQNGGRLLADARYHRQCHKDGRAPRRTRSQQR